MFSLTAPSNSPSDSEERRGNTRDRLALLEEQAGRESSAGAVVVGGQKEAQARRGDFCDLSPPTWAAISRKPPSRGSSVPPPPPDGRVRTSDRATTRPRPPLSDPFLLGCRWSSPSIRSIGPGARDERDDLHCRPPN